MQWYWMLGIGLFVGFSISNAWLRHYVLTLFIWIFKAISWSTGGIVWCCEQLQDRFDAVPVSLLQNSHRKTPTSKAWDFKKMSDKQILEKVAEKPEMSEAELIKYIQDNPDNVSIRRKGGE